MNTKIAVIVLALATLAAAKPYNARHRSTAAAPVKSYGQHVSAPAPIPVHHEPAEVEVEEEPVQYKTAVKTVARPSIRVMEREPAVSNYASNSYGSSSVATKSSADNERITDEQNKNAHYAFGSAIDDGIMDHSHVRQETRDGLKVEGSYAYSDGYIKKVVNYVADENGYRVISENTESISDSGPKTDLVNGKADVHTQISGVDNQYSVSAQEIRSNMRNTDIKQQ